MGDRIRIKENHCYIKRKYFSEALDALKGVFIAASMPLYDSSDRESVQSWACYREILNCTSLEEALIAIRYCPLYNLDGDICRLEFLGEKLGGEQEYFSALSPFVEPGSSLSFDVEGKGKMSWNFTGNGVVCEKEWE